MNSNGRIWPKADIGGHLCRIPSNKALHGPPVDSVPVDCHGSCSLLLFLWQEPRQSPGARKLERWAEASDCPVSAVDSGQSYPPV